MMGHRRRRHGRSCVEGVQGVRGQGRRPSRARVVFVVHVVVVFVLVGRSVFSRIGRHVQPVEHYFDISSSDPILEYGRVVEIRRARSAFECAESDSTRGSGRLHSRVPVGIRASSFLFVSFRYSRPVRSAVNASALTRIKLERLPRLSIIDAFVYGDRIGFGRAGAKLQAHVCQFVFFAQRQGEGHVVRRRIRRQRRRERLRPPASDVVRIVQIRQMRSGEPLLGQVVVADVASGRSGAGGRIAVLGRSVLAASARSEHGRVEGCVHEVGNAPLRSVLVVAGVRGLLLGCVGALVALAEREKSEARQHAGRQPSD